jgi:hypothetical protein
MTTEEAKNKFIERHNNALEMAEVQLESIEIISDEFKEYREDVRKGEIYLLSMGYSNIHSIRSIIDAYSWEKKINDYGFSNETLYKLDETFKMIRSFVVYVFKQRFNLTINFENQIYVAFNPSSYFQISTVTTLDYRALYAEMLQIESINWHKRLKRSYNQANPRFFDLEFKETILFKVMNVDAEGDPALTLGAIDDFIITTEFNDANILEYSEILSYALGGIMVNGEGSVWAFSEDGVYAVVNQFDTLVYIVDAVESHISDKSSTMIFQSYTNAVNLFEQISFQQQYSMKEITLNALLAVEQVGIIKN